ncbi:shufflon system plasmid conjugative transfer pilus tip adhesin PilV [Salmonella enterica subsp. diarizonae]|uniref:Shufflon system plasmid conjugative transfer pilus tip adhesin PilV n=1 Tax=Salmonella enterica TaxID=28901 RepID=A0A403T5P8_SALER|nr:shufflon system plasmid conjugative transfer pilus tip adhesin PilV [Salmonella enterica subsp. diarizonae]MMS79169.1 shufflon system plasmid conjugative transfer pilus tip adhesin PilV [Salmonella enterica]
MRKIDRGWASLEFGAVMLLVMIIVAWGASALKDHIERKNWQTEARLASTWAAAARSYTGKNYSTLLAASTATRPAVITTAMLKNTGFLSGGFSNTNSNGQKMQAYVVRNAQNPALLQAMVVSAGGAPFPLKALIQMASEITTGFGGYVDDGKTATGALRVWKIPLSDYGAASGNGHIAILLSTDELSGAAEDTDRLYRFQVNGRPDLNKMHTSIDMGGNNLDSAGTVSGQQGNFSLSVTAGGDIRSNNGWLITRSGKGWLNESHGGGFYMSDNDWIRSVNNKGIYTGGQLKGGSVRSDSDLSAGGILKLDQVNVAGTWCPQKGALSYDSSGGILLCQSGRWESNSKLDGRYSYIGSFQSAYSSVNQSDKAIMVYASGGTSILNKKVKDGDNCLNTWALAGQVNGSFITGAGSANSNWSKSGSISFLVPSGSTWSVISDPLPSYGCSPGSFSINVFTLN